MALCPILSKESPMMANTEKHKKQKNKNDYEDRYQVKSTSHETQHLDTWYS